MKTRANPSRSFAAPVRRLGVAAGLALGLALAIPRAHAANIYGYVDAEGNAHFATQALDARYRLFMRGGGALDPSKIGKGPSRAKSPDNPLVRLISAHPNLKKYEAMVERAAAEFNLEPALLKAIMAAESGFNPNAVSPKGAVGLMQIMPATAERYGVQGDRQRTLHQKLTDPGINIRLAARYLHDLNKIFPQNTDLTIASYNAGENAVQKYSNQIPPYPETQNYVQLVAQFYQLYASGRKIADSGAAAPASVQATGSGRITAVLRGRSKLPAPVTVSSDAGNTANDAD
ncbi:MAG: lytic transglycosylase [Herbaspirillum sp.]|nr:lytic transglycosylase [Herbaspirillum sp.]